MKNSSRIRVSCGYMLSETPQSSSYTPLKQPAAMSEDGDMAANWREWKSAFDYYMIATSKENAAPREKCALFLHVIGQAGRKLLHKIDLNNETENDYDKLVSKFALHYDPARNVNSERQEFFETYQNDNSFDVFLDVLKEKSESCEFGNLRSSLILTQIIRGIEDSDLRELLLRKPKLDLEQAVVWCQVAERDQKERTRQQAEGFSLKAEVASQWRKSSLAEAFTDSHRLSARYFRRSITFSSCDYCGSKHGVGDKCMAWDAICYKCERLGHFAKMCRESR